MIYRIMLTLLLFAALNSPARASAVECEGRFVNPITDICWECLFPISIGSIAVSTGSAPDTSNPSMPIQICPMGIFYRVGLAIGYWEPMALTDVTRAPYCLVNMGGISLGVGKVGTGTAGQSDKDAPGAFYHVHWYKYPLTYWLNIITSMGCLQGGDMDIGYLSELDPTWNDSSIALILSPEAMLFNNVIAQGPALPMPWPVPLASPSTHSFGVLALTVPCTPSPATSAMSSAPCSPPFCSPSGWPPSCTAKAWS